MSLFPSKIRNHMKRAITFGGKCHAHPFVWNEELDRPEVCRSKEGRFIWRVNIAISAFHLLFVVVQTVRVSLDVSSSNTLKIYMRFMFLNTIFGMVSQLANVKNGSQLPGFFYQFSTLMKEFEGKKTLKCANNGHSASAQSGF